jgi:hypothetical protein
MMCIDFCKKAKERLRRKLETGCAEKEAGWKSIIVQLDADIERLEAELAAEKAKPKRPTYCKPAKCPFKPTDPPDPPPPEEKRLSIDGDKILYGNKPIKLCGVSRWEALWRETGEHGSPGWGQYSLEWYEQQLIDSGINYMRHAGIKNTQLLYDHCKRMKDAGIIVEVSVYRASEASEGVLVNLEEMGAVSALSNVFFDINNEFSGAPESVERAVALADLLYDGCIVSGGAWSGGAGLLQSEAFHGRYPHVDIVSHHRDWTEASFRSDLVHGKPVVWSEYFAHKDNLSLSQVENLMNLAFECGLFGCQYYGFRFKGLPGLINEDPFDYREILTYAGKLTEKYND